MPATPPATAQDWLTWTFWAADSQSLYQLFLIVAGLIGVFLLAWRTIAADRQARAALRQAEAALAQAKVAAKQAKTAADRHVAQTEDDRERRITESFAKAVEQLGSDKLPTRLGAIYTLERLSQESEREYWPIMETLTAFVRENAPWPPRNAPTDDANDENRRPAADIQAILTVLGRRREDDRKRDAELGRRLDLRSTDLRGANLSKAHLEGAFMESVHLERASLYAAHLEKAFLFGAQLQGAFLSEADIRQVSLNKANLNGANLIRSRIDGAILDSARLEGASLCSAQLVGTNLFAANLSGANLAEADAKTADLRGAVLIDACLAGADLRGAHVDGADLDEAHLRGANLADTDVTQPQLDSARGDERTLLPPRLTRPAHWTKGVETAGG